MNFIFFIYIPLVHSVSHTLMTTYTKINGKTNASIPEISAVTTLDGREIDYYDNEIKKLIPRQDWMKEFTSGDRFKGYTEIRERIQQIYKINITALMQQFNQSNGVHTFQRMYGCERVDETGESHGFDKCGYDGEDFITLDVEEGRYTAHVQQAEPTVLKWNNDRKQLDFVKKYYDRDCIYWLRKFLHFSKDTFINTEPPKMSLLKKNPDYYVKCHVTGFHFRETTVLWKTNERDITNVSKLVESGETLPNEDGTFQRYVSLKFLPDDWKTNQYTCVADHESLPEPVQKNLTVNDTKSSAPDASHVTYPVIFLILLVCALPALCVRHYCWNKPKPGKKITYPKTPSPSPPGDLSKQHLMASSDQNHFPEHSAS